MEPFRPRLRPELFVDAAAGAIVDPLLPRKLPLGALSGRIAARLDGETALEPLLDEIAAAAGAERAAVEHAARVLLLNNLVEGAGDAIVARARSLAAAPESLLFLDEDRFACQGSGACCRSYVLGPLAPADVERLAALDLASVWPDLADEPYLVEHEWEDGTTGWFLRKTLEEACVFQLPDERCGIHAVFGADAKPGMCRDYPLQIMRTVDGVKLYYHGECATFSTSAWSGAPLSTEIERLRPHVAAAPLEHPLVLLDGSTTCDHGHLLRVQRALCDLVALGLGDAAATVSACGELLHRFVAAMRACPLLPGEPDRTLDALLARDPRELYDAAAAPDEESRRHRCYAVSSLAARVRWSLARTIDEAAARPERPLAARYERELSHVLEFARALAACRADPEAHPLPDELRAPAAVAVADPAIEALLRRSLRQQLFGNRFLIEQRPVAGLARIAFVHLLTLLGAKLRAAAAGSPRIRAADFDAAHGAAQRTLRYSAPARAFVDHESLAWEVLATAPSLAFGDEATAPRSPLLRVID